MAAFVVTNLMCDTCTLVGPNTCRIGESGEVVLPDGWLVEGAECYCSATCKIRRGEVGMSPSQWPLMPGLNRNNPPYALKCINTEAKGRRCLEPGCLLHVMSLDRVLPAGWTEVVFKTDDRRYGLCPACQEIGEQKR